MSQKLLPHAIDMAVLLYERENDERRVPDDELVLTPDGYTFALAAGGPDKATIQAAGSPQMLWSLLSRLRSRIEIVTRQDARRAWWGYVHVVTLLANGREFRVSLDDVYNRISVLYTTEGDSLQTGYLEDADSIAAYGTRELVESASDITTNAAQQLQAALLDIHRYPTPSVRYSGGNYGQISATLECRGWLWQLETRYYNRVSEAQAVAGDGDDALLLYWINNTSDGATTMREIDAYSGVEPPAIAPGERDILRYFGGNNTGTVARVIDPTFEQGLREVTSSEIDIDTGSVTESFLISKSTWYQLANEEVADDGSTPSAIGSGYGGFELTDDPPTKTFVQGDDYFVQCRYGYIIANPDSTNIADGEAVIATYRPYTRIGGSVLEEHNEAMFHGSTYQYYAGSDEVLVLYVGTRDPTGDTVTATRPTAWKFTNLGIGLANERYIPGTFSISWSGGSAQLNADFWECLGTVGGSNPKEVEVNATATYGCQIPADGSTTITQSAGFIDAVLVETVDYTLNLTTNEITMIGGYTSGDDIYVVYARYPTGSNQATITALDTPIAVPNMIPGSVPTTNGGEDFNLSSAAYRKNMVPLVSAEVSYSLDVSTIEIDGTIANFTVPENVYTEFIQREEVDLTDNSAAGNLFADFEIGEVVRVTLSGQDYYTYVLDKLAGPPPVLKLRNAIPITAAGTSITLRATNTYTLDDTDLLQDDGKSATNIQAPHVWAGDLTTDGTLLASSVRCRAAKTGTPGALRAEVWLAGELIASGSLAAAQVATSLTTTWIPLSDTLSVADATVYRLVLTTSSTNNDDYYQIGTDEVDAGTGSGWAGYILPQTDSLVSVIVGTADPVSQFYALPSTIVVTDDSGSPTYTLDTDYSLSVAGGYYEITPLVGGGITTGDTLTVTYSYYAFQTQYDDTVVPVALDTIAETSALVAQAILPTFSSIFSGVTVRDASGVFNNPTADNITVLERVKQLLAIGTTNNRRLALRVLPNRRIIVYEEPAYADTTALYLDADGTLHRYSGNEDVPSWTLELVGAWLVLRGLIPPYVNLLAVADPSRVFVEAADYDIATGRVRAWRARGVRDIFAIGRIING